MIVEAATKPPYACAASGVAHGRFVDTHRQITGTQQHIYLSEQFIKESATEFGWVSGAQHQMAVQAMQERVRDLEALVMQQEQEIATLKAFKTSVDTIVSSDYVARKKPGRPQKETV